MGGIHSSNLMSDVTVIIVGDRSTEKFQFGVKNRADIRFIKPEAVLEIHRKWINNEDSTLDLNEYLLPVFDGLRICISRLKSDDYFSIADQDRLGKLISENGGEVSDSLGNSTSMVITNEKSGRRYTVARKWKVPNVHPLWVLDCVKRKAMLDQQYYDIDKVEKIGEGSCNVWNELTTRKRKRLVVEEEEQIKKKPEVWNTIMTEAKRQVSSAKRRNDWGEHEEKDIFDLRSINQPKKLSFIQPPVASKLFEGRLFALEFFEEDRTATLTRTIQSHSGTIVSPENDPTYTIIPSDFSTRDIPKHFMGSKVMTEFFLERCLHYKEIRDDVWGEPFYQPILQPQQLSVSITGFQGIELLHITRMIALSGFEFHDFLTKDRDVLLVNYDLLRAKSGEHLVKKYPTLFDAEFKKNASQTSIQSTSKKLNFARKNAIPILTVTFIFDSFLDGVAPNINNKDCCIYCPKLAHLKESLKPLTMSDIDRTVAKSMTSSSSSLPKLPSPIRNKRQEKWGRLVGRAPESQFQKNLHDTLSNVDFEEEEHALKSTQIGYDGTEPNDGLLTILNQQSEKTRARAVISERRTRQGYKDILNVLDND